MPTEAALASEYDSKHPGVQIPIEQKAERQERRHARARGQAGHPMRIVTPEGAQNLKNDRPAAEWEEIGPNRFRRVPPSERS